MFSRKWDWFFGVEEGGGNRDQEPQCNNQGSQHDGGKGGVHEGGHDQESLGGNQGPHREGKGGCQELQLNCKDGGGHQESQLDGNAPPPQCNALPPQWGGHNHQFVSRKWNWFFGVKEGGGDQEESLRDNQGSQCDSDSMGGCVDRLDVKVGRCDQESQGNS